MHLINPKCYLERMKAALYIRVSTDEQNASNQLPALEGIARQRGFSTITFSDVMSGTKTSRPGFDAMMAAARRGEFQVLLVWALDRVGRSMSHTIETVEVLDRAGVAIISHQEPWLDTGGPVRPLLLAIFSWVAQNERERLVERTRAGLKAARKAGKTLGRPRRSVDLNALAKLRKDGLSIRDAAARLGVGAGTIHRALQDADLPESVR